MTEDKDRELAEAATQAMATLRSVDKDYTAINRALEHSK